MGADALISLVVLVPSLVTDVKLIIEKSLIVKALYALVLIEEKAIVAFAVAPNWSKSAVDIAVLLAGVEVTSAQLSESGLTTPGDVATNKDITAADTDAFAVKLEVSNK